MAMTVVLARRSEVSRRREIADSKCADIRRHSQSPPSPGTSCEPEKSNRRPCWSQKSDAPGTAHPSVWKSRPFDPQAEGNDSAPPTPTPVKVCLRGDYQNSENVGLTSGDRAPPHSAGPVAVAGSAESCFCGATTGAEGRVRLRIARLRSSNSCHNADRACHRNGYHDHDPPHSYFPRSLH
jgi:hypothetical protein